MPRTANAAASAAASQSRFLSWIVRFGARFTAFVFAATATIDDPATNVVATPSATNAIADGRRRKPFTPSTVRSLSRPMPNAPLRFWSPAVAEYDGERYAAPQVPG